MLLSVAFIHVGYSSNVPKTKNYQSIEKGTEYSVLNKISSEDDDWFYSNSLLAQAETDIKQNTSSNQNIEETIYTEADVVQAQEQGKQIAEQNTEQKLLDIAKALNIKVDPNISQEELYNQIVKQSESVPKKEDSPATWISWIWAGIGTLLSAILFAKNKSLQKST